MECVICKQERALKAKMLIGIILIVASVMLFFGSTPLLPRVVFFLGSLIMMGFSVSYKINKDFKNKKLYAVFGLVLFESNLSFEFPDYISVFSGSFSINNDWATVSALGTKERHEKTVVRFFTENRKTTVFSTNNYTKALKKASELSDLLGVKMYYATKS